MRIALYTTSSGEDEEAAWPPRSASRKQRLAGVSGARAARRSRPSATCGCTSPAWAPTRTTRCRCIVRGEGCYVCDEHGKRYLDGLVRALLRERRPRPRRARRGGRARRRRSSASTSNWSYAHPPRDRARRAHRGARAGRPQPRLLHLRRLGGGRVGLEAGAQLPPAARRGPAHEADRARARLPRHVARRARRHRPDRRCARRSSRSRPAAATSRTRTATAGRPTATRCGPRTRSRSGSSSRARRRSPP